MDTTRKIIHVDMDAFFASVEQRDNPKLRGKPVIVGGPPGTRSVVAACSYETRKFGVHSGMPSGKAHKLCPEAIFVKAHFDAYKKASQQIREIFLQYTDLVEPLSLDEAYLDVTVNRKNCLSATIIAKEIKQKILSATRLTASAGVSYCKFLAKVASDFRKPDGLTVIPPESSAEFIEKLPIGKFHGIGRVTEKKMQELGINTGLDLKNFPKNKLLRLFGKVGEFYWQIAHGIDDRPVETEWERQSIGHETTLRVDIDDKEQLFNILDQLSEAVFRSTEKKGLSGRTLTLKVRYADFQTITRSLTTERPFSSVTDIMKQSKSLLARTEAGEKKIRLLGLTVSGFEENRPTVKVPEQLLLPFAPVSGRTSEDSFF